MIHPAPNTPWLGGPPGQQAAFVKAFCVAEMGTAEIAATGEALRRAARDVGEVAGFEWIRVLPLPALICRE